MTNPEHVLPEDRVSSFLDGWSRLHDKADLIYGVGVGREDVPRDLLASDLRRLLDLLTEFRMRDEAATRVIESARERLHGPVGDT